MHLLFNWWLIDFHIKIGESGFNWHPTSYSCTVIGSCEPTSFKSISLWANEWLIYHSASLRGNKFASFEPTTLWVANLQISNLRGFYSTKYFLKILYSGILHEVNVQNFSYLHVRARYLLCSFHKFKQNHDSWLKPGRCSTIVWKVEINLHIKDWRLCGDWRGEGPNLYSLLYSLFTSF